MSKVAFFSALCGLIFAPILAAEDCKTLIAQGDELYLLRADPAKARAALDKYMAATKIDGNCYEAFWKIAKTLYSVGKSANTNKEKMKLFNDGVHYAKKAIALNANGVEGHFWLGVNYGLYGEARGVLKSLFLVDDIKEEMREVIRIDEGYEGAGAHRVLGRMYWKLPGIAGGSNKKSRMHLEKSRQMCPSNTLTLLYLAETYWDMDMKWEAIQTLEQLMETPADPRWIPETAEDKYNAEKMLLKYKSKISR